MDRGVKGIFMLLWMAFKRMPFLVIVWFALPTAAGFTMLLGANAQIRLINLAASGYLGKSTGGMIELIAAPVAVYTAAASAKALCRSLKNILDKELVERYTYGIQSDIIDCTMNAPMELFEDAEFHNKLARATAASKENLLDIFNRLSALIQMLMDLIFIMFILNQGHWLLPVFASAVSGLTLLQRLWIEIKVQSLNRGLTYEGRMADYLKDSAAKHNVIKELRIFGSLSYILEKWNGLAVKQSHARGEMRRKEIKSGIIFTFARPASLIVSVCLLIYGLQHGNVTPGIVAVAFQKIIEAQFISVMLSYPLSKIYVMSSKAAYIAEFLSAGRYSSLKGRNKPSSAAAIRFENVSFTYPGAGKPTIEDVSFSIKHGEIIALVGENGSGKTTLTNLLLGLYSATGGTAYWDEQDYASLEPELLCGKMSAVFQDFVRYELTIRENAGLGETCGMSDDQRLNSVLRECGALEAVEAAGGLDTPLGRVLEGSRELSGGQWQKLAVARAMYKDAGFIILDEPTAALDPNSELELFKNFKRLARGKTAVFVSHRLGWARFADRILVMDKGRLVETGTHDELMSRNGRYAQSFTAQAAWYR